MLFGRKTDSNAVNGARTPSRWTLCVLSASLLAGCGSADVNLSGGTSGDGTSSPTVNGLVWEQPADVLSVDALPTVRVAQALGPVLEPPRSRVAAKISTADLFNARSKEAMSPTDMGSLADNGPLTIVLPIETPAEEPGNPYWSFPSRGQNDSTSNQPDLIRLPAVEVPLQTPVKTLDDEQPSLRLLPLTTDNEDAAATQPQKQLQDITPTPNITTENVRTSDENETLLQQQQQLDLMLQDASSAATGVLTDGRINDLAKKKIQQAYALASRGALFVAREELIEVLRMISQAKDVQQGTPAHTKALAAGIRALREAEDFSPRGTQLEAELNVAVLCASHRTPVAKQPSSTDLLPRLMMDRYLRYAQLQLAMSVAREPAGSMALHALGKISSQLGRIDQKKHRLSTRQAIVFQQAALFAHSQNHLAAHELGVLLASSGHLTEAHQLLKQVASREPNTVVFQNLARIEKQLGQTEQANVYRAYARQMTQQGATGTNNVQWVSPEQFAQGQQARQMQTQIGQAQPPVQQPIYSQHAVAQRPANPTLIIPGSRRYQGQGQPPIRR